MPATRDSGEWNSGPIPGSPGPTISLSGSGFSVTAVPGKWRMARSPTRSIFSGSILIYQDHLPVPAKHLIDTRITKSDHGQNVACPPGPILLIPPIRNITVSRIARSHLPASLFFLLVVILVHVTPQLDAAEPKNWSRSRGSHSTSWTTGSRCSSTRTNHAPPLRST